MFGKVILTALTNSLINEFCELKLDGIISELADFLKLSNNYSFGQIKLTVLTEKLTVKLTKLLEIKQ